MFSQLSKYTKNVKRSDIHWYEEERQYYLPQIKCQTVERSKESSFRNAIFWEFLTSLSAGFLVTCNDQSTKSHSGSTLLNPSIEKFLAAVDVDVSIPSFLV